MSELLAPAGTLDKLKWAVQYGADAVYFGIQSFSLRSYAGNFSMDDVNNAMTYLRKYNKKGYVTLNIYPWSHEYDALLTSARQLEDIGVDAFIVSDLGVIWTLKNNGLQTPIHISTQANTLSYQTVLAYANLGAKRVNLARELSLEQIGIIQSQIKNYKIETEVFIHGAVCFSYSGRCAISDYLASRKANRGECTHPCRWKYHLVEEKRPGDYLPVFEDSRGTYLMNTKELALFPFVEDLTAMGVHSFKIEGRMKSIHYVAATVAFYRQVLDGSPYSEEAGLALLNRISNRGYSYGFMKGSITPEDYAISQRQSTSHAKFVGDVVTQTDDGYIFINVRNTIHAGERLEILMPSGQLTQMVLPDSLCLSDHTIVKKANHGSYIRLKADVPRYSIFRRVHH
ncbi:MAG: protease [Candidatus Magnetoglobus multicellularis str. Araruama]|uniref:Protease n=1 Tax=Candidatus Magnetoglobus multicellularis str. Araruama TaxID=890399 RepID=A0A1V1P073_9BACT|nr:MAG: protease [Candidatus Magnetoglobus multicellularis str. Araruama]